ncbi:MAG: hypothetical protein P8J87_03405 [Verrucomicrobiales bacterium]|nr:hypothetical protein [Verrucomicrobiales bacterium]
MTEAGFAALLCAATSRDRLQSVSDQLAAPDERSPWLSSASHYHYLTLAGDQRLPHDVHQPGCDTTAWQSSPLYSLRSPHAIRADFTVDDPAHHTGAIAKVSNAGAISFFLNGKPLPKPTGQDTITIPIDRFQNGQNTISASGIFPLGFEFELSPQPLTIVGRLRQLDPARAAETLRLDPAATAWLHSEHATAIGNHLAAAKHLTKVTLTHPHRPNTLNRLGLAQLRIGDKPAAARSFEQAIQASPLDPDFQHIIRGNLINTLRQLDRSDEAHTHWLTQNNIVARDPNLPKNLIDLTPHFNATLDRDPVYPGSGNAYSDLAPRGHTLAGIHFDIRGLVIVNGSRINGPTRTRYPENLRIELKNSAYTLHFLHAVLHAVDSSGTQVGTYRIHYANGTTADTPIVTGENTRDWWLHPDAEISADLPGSTLAWTGTNPHIGDRNIKTSLYLYSWTNPRPDIGIEAIELISTMQQGAPFLAALTIDPVE